MIIEENVFFDLEIWRIEEKHKAKSQFPNF